MVQKPATTRIPRQLRESDVHGKGAAEIGWGTPGDFNRCRAFMRRHDVPGIEIDGACANLHRLATGEWPGPNAHKGHLATVAVISLVAAMGTYNPITWNGPLARIESPTGDRRQFPRDTLTYQSFPQPLRWQRQGMQGHMGAVTVGVIEDASEKDVNEQTAAQYGIEPGRYVWGNGYFLDPNIVPEVNVAVHQVEHGVSGPSVDLDSYMAVLHRDEMSGETVANMKRGRQRAATLVSVPAFANLRIKVVHPKDPAVPAADTANIAAGATFAVNGQGWHGAPIAPREALFNADDAAKRIEGWANGDPAKMAKMFLWVADSPNDPLIGRRGFRLPWGDIVDNKPYLIYHAIYAAAALLQGGHGGLPNIPDEEKAKLRSVISSIYEELAQQFNDPSMVAPWDQQNHVQQQQAAGGPVDDDEYEAYLWSYGAALEEFVSHHRYTESKHPRVPGKPGGRRDHVSNPKGGEWIDTPHGPHGQIKVGSKWIYPPKKGEKGYESPERAVRGIAERGGGSKAARKAPDSMAGRQRHTVRHGPSVTELEREKDKKRAAELRGVAGQVKRPAPVAHVERKRQPHAPKPPQGELNESQQKALEALHADPNAKIHGATRKALERRGYLDGEGKLTQKAREHLGVTGKKNEENNAPKAAEPKGTAVEKAAEKRRVERANKEHKAAQPMVAKRHDEANKRQAAKAQEQAKAGEGRKVVVAKKAQHKITPAQQKAIDALKADPNAKIHPATRKVLEREGLIPPKPTVKEAPKASTVKEAARQRVVVAKKNPATKGFKPTPAQQKALENLRDNPDTAVHGATRKVLEREGFVDPKTGRLTQKGLDHLGISKQKGGGAPAVAKAAPKAAKVVKAPAEAVKIGPPIDPEKKAGGSLKSNRWGGMRAEGEHYFHPDGEIGNAIHTLGQRLGPIDVDGERLDNRLGDIATDVVNGKITPDEGVARYRDIIRRLPVGSEPRRILEGAVDRIDAPQVKRPDSVEGAPEPLRQLMDDLLKNPLARGSQLARGREPEVEMLDRILRDWHAGRLFPNKLKRAVMDLANRHHESNEGKVPLDRAVAKALVGLERMDPQDLKPKGPMAPKSLPNAGAAKPLEGGAPTIVRQIDQASQELGRKFTSGKKRSSRNVNAGAQGKKQIITYEDGSKVFVKDLAPGGLFAGQDGKAEADAEELASLVGRAIGADVPVVHRGGPHQVVMEHIEGKNIGDASWQKQADFRASREGLLIGLLDLLIGNGDRHNGNIMITPEGRVVGIDHGLGWVYLQKRHDKGFGPEAIVNAYLASAIGPVADHFLAHDFPITTADVAKIRRRLEALRPHFKAAGREDWLDRSLEVLHVIEKRANAKKDVIRGN
jgi:phosphoinositide 3-/4-kinase-like protein